MIVEFTANLKREEKGAEADEEGADWQEAVQIIFGLDPDKEPERAKYVHDSHLKRAIWMTEQGYKDLLRPPLH